MIRLQNSAGKGPCSCIANSSLLSPNPTPQITSAFQTRSNAGEPPASPIKRQAAPSSCPLLPRPAFYLRLSLAVRMVSHTSYEPSWVKQAQSSRALFLHPCMYRSAQRCTPQVGWEGENVQLGAAAAASAATAGCPQVPVSVENGSRKFGVL